MNEFVSMWKADHRNILELLDQLNDAGVENKAWHEQFLDLREKVVSHLKMEDVKLYPVFREKAKNDPRAECIIDLFDQEMKEISKQAMVFFQKYDQGGEAIDFFEDFKGINAALRKRIWSEENVLLEEYHRVIQK